MNQLGLELRDRGIERAVDHADREIPSWSDVALEYVRQYARNHGEFLSEEPRQYAESRGLPDPPDKRAWGAVMLRAARAGYIRKIGYAQANDPRVHGSINTLWRGHGR